MSLVERLEKLEIQYKDEKNEIEDMANNLNIPINIIE